MTTPMPTGLRPVTVHLTGSADEPIGTCAIRLVLTAPGQATDEGAWAITHPLGMPAGGTHTEVAFVDDTSTELPERLVDDLVRQIGNRMYPGSWAFHYRPNRVPDAVLQYGSLLRERIEVSAVEVWDA
jgi:hypothetical protein